MTIQQKPSEPKHVHKVDDWDLTYMLPDFVLITLKCDCGYTTGRLEQIERSV